MYETIVIGAGLAGLTASIYAARKKMNFVCLTKDFGGQVLETGEILNYPGIIKTTGLDFYELLRQQADFNQLPIREQVEIKSIKKNNDSFLVISDQGEYQTKSIIVATGARARRINVPGESRLANRGVSYCSICDGPLFAGKKVAIIGGGNSALEAADFLLNIARKIYIINLNDQFIGHEYLIESIMRHTHQGKVDIIYKANTTAILGDQRVEAVEYEQNREKKTLAVEGVFVQIGRSPNSEFVKGFLQLDEHDHIMINCDTSTSVNGVFAAGDCSSVHEYQYAVAAGQGCTALLKVAKYLQRL